ncbi:MAG: cyanophycin synthetase, partial [Pseudomonadota bacterium]
GHAAYNVANALTAAAAAAALGLPVDAIRAGLEGFKSENADNPGRGNLYSVDGARVLVDFAHHVHGIDAVVRTVKAFPARRRLLMFGQAGHRSDAELAAITDAALKLDPERIVLTDSEHYRRGREPMAVPRRLRELCVDRGVDPARISLHASPLEGVEACLAWAGDGDACLLLTLGDRDRIAELLHSREAESRPAGSTAGAGP